MNTVRQYIAAHPNAFDEITFISFSELDFRVYQAVYSVGEFTVTVE